MSTTTPGPSKTRKHLRTAFATAACVATMPHLIALNLTERFMRAGGDTLVSAASTLAPAKYQILTAPLGRFAQTELPELLHKATDGLKALRSRFFSEGYDPYGRVEQCLDYAFNHFGNDVVPEIVAMAADKLKNQPLNKPSAFKPMA